MGLFGRLLGNKPPVLPAGAHAYVDGYGPLRDHYAVFYVVPYDTTPVSVGPVFATGLGAQMYAAYVNGTGELDWDVNGVSMPV